MTYFENGIRRLGSFLLAGAMVVSGCSGYIPIKRFGEHDSDGSTYAEMGARVGIDIAKMNIGLDKEKRRTQIYTGASITGETEIYDDAFGPRLILGFECSIKKDNLRFKIGEDAKAGPSNYDDENTQTWNISPPNTTNGYKDIKAFTLAPFIGFDAELSDKIGIGFEFGLPSTDVNYEVGQYTWNRHKPYAKDSWKDVGKSITVKIGSLSDDKFFMGLSFGIERYDVELNGEKTNIDVQSASLFFSRRF